MAIQGQFLVVVGQCPAPQYDLHDIVVEVRDFRPAVAHAKSELVGMSTACEYRIGVVVDHGAGLAPQADDGHVGPEDETDRRHQVRRPR